MITLRILTWNTTRDHPEGPNAITRVLNRERQEGQSVRRYSEDGRRAQSDVASPGKESRQSLEVGKARDQILSRTRKEGAQSSCPPGLMF